MQRLTRQRVAILKCFSGATRPLSVEEILLFASKDISNINLSTVYRNLKTLIGQGTINPVELPGGDIRYEVIEAQHHHHFLCEKCDRLFNIPGCPAGLAAMVPKGFKLQSHSITLRGTCTDCNPS
jgi:Fur family transcriptional regulator, ferric uptake regulator